MVVVWALNEFGLRESLPSNIVTIGNPAEHELTVTTVDSVGKILVKFATAPVSPGLQLPVTCHRLSCPQLLGPLCYLTASMPAYLPAFVHAVCHQLPVFRLFCGWCDSKQRRAAG